ncbi:MAG TPA: hypothetical protein VHV77_15395 [Pirellulales bacterium]|jgi:hypothetical protein|nr:hypothetical protein [Pirellulales bacterium]
MSERTRRIIIAVAALLMAIPAVSYPASHWYTNSAAIAAGAFLLVAVMPWSWHGWHERPPADKQG